MGNAERLTTVLRDFGFDMPEVNPELFLRERMIIRMGVPPMRIEITNHIDGVEFPATRDASWWRSTRFLSISSRWMISR
jgi:hypothetical protein